MSRKHFELNPMLQIKRVEGKKIRQGISGILNGVRQSLPQQIGKFRTVKQATRFLDYAYDQLTALGWSDFGIHDCCNTKVYLLVKVCECNRKGTDILKYTDKWMDINKIIKKRIIPKYLMAYVLDKVRDELDNRSNEILKESEETNENR